MKRRVVKLIMAADRAVRKWVLLEDDAARAVITKTPVNAQLVANHAEAMDELSNALMELENKP